MSHFVSTTWKGGFAFDSTIGNHTIHIDNNAGPGHKTGPNPKPLMLASLAGCTGMDIVSLLEKMRVKVATYRMDAEAELTDEHPKIYSVIRLKYFFEGKNLKVDKIIKAVRLSKDRYCGVSAMLAMVCPIEVSVFVNGEMVMGPDEWG
ncbi:MAG TPA: OsmC family peroxiredoxin [Bacteroidetes bacterium]|nr:OsmC family peroxiredoxin [Bacteroidota bacterium]